MSEEVINGELVEQNEDALADPVILNNLGTLVDVANRAEKYVEAVSKIKSIVLKITNNNDWIDEQGKPYLQASGAEKIASVFRINWRFPGKPTLDPLDDGHFMYTVKGEFSMGSVKIEAYGTRSSSDPFFGRRYNADVPASEIDRANVMKSAVTNCIGNGITRILGIRNLTWEELKTSGFTPDKTSKVERKVMDDKTKKQLDELVAMLMEMAANDKDACADLLEKYTTFTTKKGDKEETVKGRRSFKDLTAKQIPITYNKVKKDHEKFVTEMANGGWDEDIEISEDDLPNSVK